MGFQFAVLCDLLSSLEANGTAKAATAAHKDGPDYRTIAQWFSRHQRHIHHPDTDRLALLSCMFPEKRTDRVYWLGATSLARVIGRCLGLGSSRLSELDRWRFSGGPDLGHCVERVMCQTENYVPPGREVSVEEIDQALNLIASRCRFSGPQVRRQHTAVDVDGALAPLYRRLSSRDAKWLTRMILKSYSPVVLPQKFTLDKFHFLLPHLLQFQDTFEGALNMLASEPINHFPPHPDPKLASNLCSIALEHLCPRPGIKIGRPEYFKARSTKQCALMAKNRRMSIERKYDGEYCQIHIDLTNKRKPVQIFSKSGKDSTEDRGGIIEIVEDSLQLKRELCKFKNRCILEGELLVWSDKHGSIVGFHKLRKFLSRSGTYLGIDSDSPPQPYEHLMVVFFDVLLLDDDVCLRKPHRERRLRLQSIIQRIPGRADIAEQEILDFGRQGSQHRLEVSFSKAISQRWEGLVVKACDEPYFPIHSAGMDTSFGRWIKLKKDYIPGLGDTVDLALVGASYDAQHATALSTSKKLQWTHFLVGCLLNKDAVELAGAVPRFRLVDVLNRHCMHRRFMELLNHIGEFSAQSPDDLHEFETEYGHGSLPAASVLFKKPFVVEMMGSGFEKPSGARYFTLRFPRILKVHMDRTFEDAASFRELQIMAEESRSMPEEDIFAEREHWCKRLKAGNGLNPYIIRRSQSPSRSSSSSAVSDADSAGDSAITQNESEDVAGATPSIRSNQAPTERASQGQIYSSIEGAPAVYVDETLTHMQPENSERNRNVLTENGNLSSRHNSGQKGTNAPSPSKRIKTSTREPPSSSRVSRPSGLPINSLVSMHRDRIHSKLAAGQDSQDSRVLESYSKAQPPISPLTTVPVYMGTSASEMSTETQDRESEGLSQFLRLIGSVQTTRMIQRSNPRAVSQGTALGIVLVDLVQTSLGPEIHRISETLSKILAAGVPSGPSKGKIFFLDSLILEQNIRPDDSRFCLRQTWSEIGSQFFYTCLRWNVHWKARKRKVGDETNSGGLEDPGPPNQGERPSMSLAVSFDESEILAAGEYISIEPPLHFI